MKQSPAFDTVVGQSHAVNTKVELRAPDDTVIGTLPVEAGTITGDATRRVGRWAGDLTLAGLDWAPDGPDHPLAGLGGHYCSVQRAAAPYGASETWVEVARLWVYETTVQMSRYNGQLRVRLVSPAGLLERAVHDDFTAQRNNPIQQMISDVLKVNLPYTPTVVDSSTPAQLPAAYDPKDVTPLQVAEDLAAAANIRVYFDALGRIVMRDTLPSLDVAGFTTARQLAVDIDVVRYTLTFGRSLFANDAIARYDWDDDQGQPQGVIGRSHISGGPFAKDGPAGRLTVERQYDVDASGAQANGFAASMLTSQRQAWVTSRIDAVQDPRIEPDDIVETRYLDRTLRHRVVGVQFDLTTDAMQLTGRTTLAAATDGGGGGTQPGTPTVPTSVRGPWIHNLQTVATGQITMLTKSMEIDAVDADGVDHTAFLDADPQGIQVEDTTTGWTWSTNITSITDDGDRYSIDVDIPRPPNPPPFGTRLTLTMSR